MIIIMLRLTVSSLVASREETVIQCTEHFLPVAL